MTQLARREGVLNSLTVPRGNICTCIPALRPHLFETQYESEVANGIMAKTIPREALWVVIFDFLAKTMSSEQWAEWEKRSASSTLSQEP